MRLSYAALGIAFLFSMAVTAGAQEPAPAEPGVAGMAMPARPFHPGDLEAPGVPLRPQLPRGQFVATPDEISLAEERLYGLVPPDIEEYFDLYLYVSKATSGALAQRMFIFERGPDQLIHPTVQWLVSTGRERREKYFTTTPEGIYKLDIDRMHRMWWSRRWDAPMPFAIFFDYTIKSGKAGLAVHATPSHIDELGRRASGGCVRLHPEHARALFERLSRPESRGLVPVFAFKPELSRTARDGEVLRNEKGGLVLQAGLKVLLIIENFDGVPAIYAPLVAASEFPKGVGG